MYPACANILVGTIFIPFCFLITSARLFVKYVATLTMLFPKYSPGVLASSLAEPPPAIKLLYKASSFVFNAYS